MPINIALHDRQVVTYRLLNVTDHLTEGCYQRTVLGRSIFCNYVKTVERRGTSYWYLTVDTRPNSDQFSSRPPLVADPNTAVNMTIDGTHLTWDCMLSIDLGNTRTAALIFDRINDPSAITHIPVARLTQRWKVNGSIGKKVQNDCFDSFVALTDPSCGFRNDASFVKMGDFAMEISHPLANRYAENRFCLSSPKRYFYDCDPRLQPWIALQSETGDTTSRLSCSRLARQLYPDETDRLPPSRLLGAMVAELLEQANYQINTEEFRGNDPTPRRIACIHLTYPSPMNPSEKKLYLDEVIRGVRSYCTITGQEPIPVYSGIDEATSVLLFYSFNETMRYHKSPRLWLSVVGSTNALGHSVARYATIDIGGGTSDLAIADVSCPNNPMQPESLNLLLLYSTGINRAGDDLVQRMMLPVIEHLMWSFLGHISGYSFDRFRAFVNRDNGDTEKNKQLIRRCLLPLVFCVMNKLDLAAEYFNHALTEFERNPNGNADELKQNLKPCLAFSLSHEALEEVMGRDAAGMFEAKLGKFASECEGAAGPIDSISLNWQLVLTYRNAVRTCFRQQREQFSKLINEFQCDGVLFAGKTSEFRYVRNYIRALIDLPDYAITSMKDFPTRGNWCPLADNDGVLHDPKLATALGGGLFQLTQGHCPWMPIATNFTIGDFTAGGVWEWYYVATEDAPLFDPLRLGQNTVLMNHSPFFLIRKRPNGTLSILSYQLRIAPRYANLQPQYPITVTLDVTNDAVRLVNAQGAFVGSPEALNVDALELRICNQAESLYWLDGNL